jgi:predicted AAA+ superfamily ATPase
MKNRDKLYKRDYYLNKLIAFKDKEPVKIITGIRRCGKSSLLKLMMNYLLEEGISKKQIIYMNFESFEFSNFTASLFYNYVKEKTIKNKKMYLFFDEVQTVYKWERVVNAFRVDFDVDIYLTGSNAYLLSSEYSTYLAGRYVEIKMLPLSFKEFLMFNDYTLTKTTYLGEPKYVVIDRNNNEVNLNALFATYLTVGGMPSLTELDLSDTSYITLLESIYNTIIVRDILDYEGRRGVNKVTDVNLLKKITMYLSDNIGNNVVTSKISNVLINEGLISKDTRSTKPSNATVDLYIDALTKAYLFYEIKRFDVKGKAYLKSLSKYYIADIGLRNVILGLRDRDHGFILENIVYLELLRRGYDVAVGKVGPYEIDFIASKFNEKMYIQVSESLSSEEVRNRELTPLKKINDNYPKVILTLDTFVSESYNGIQVMNLLTFLLDEEN